jgi:hypothetical protein
MPQAGRTVTRIQDQDDGPGVLGAGDDGKVLAWNQAGSAFSMTTASQGDTGAAGDTGTQGDTGVQGEEGDALLWALIMS